MSFLWAVLSREAPCTGRQTGQGGRRCCGGHIEHNQYLAVALFAGEGDLRRGHQEDCYLLTKRRRRIFCVTVTPNELYCKALGVTLVFHCPADPLKRHARNTQSLSIITNHIHFV